ncbi:MULTISPECIES: metal-dependent hydrolase [unclassified Haladaptatus]|uniref:metal-dependent hydrolase n=1 Tax=unclassified Haladaptatus TaxID=2622732 RepID=UPI0023E827FE|nr:MULTISPECIES: metal-dependent hydrolase [unclassified Haladaptatus]
MWPWGHLAVGYLSYSLGARWRDASLRGHEALAVAFGTQFPDLVDKPLGWDLALLPSGRSLAHSLITALVVIAIVVAIARRFDRERVAWVFSLGYLSHLAADGFQPFVLGQFEFLTYLGWPLLPLPPYENESRSIVEHLLALDWSTFFAIELGITAIAITVWVYDGMPGLFTVTDLLGLTNRKRESTD